MGVLENHQRRRLTRDGFDLGDQRLERSLPPLWRSEVQRRIPAVVWQRQHLGQKRDVFARSRRCREPRVEPVELGLWIVLASKAGRALQLRNDRVKGAVRVLRRAEISQPLVRLARQPLQKFRREARLADASFAREQHDLSFARLRPGPAPEQKFGFFVSPDERSQPARVKRFEPALPRTFRQSHIGPRRPCHALEVLRAKVAEFEQVAEQFAGALANDDAVGRGDIL